jgi:hypothetical protein
MDHWLSEMIKRPWFNRVVLIAYFGGGAVAIYLFHFA